MKCEYSAHNGNNGAIPKGINLLIQNPLSAYYVYYGRC